MPRFPIDPMIPGCPSRALLAAVLSALVAGSGCLMQPSVSANVTTADGQTLEVPLGQGNVPVTDGVVSIKNFQFAPWDMGPNKPKAITFTFVVGFAPGSEPSSIVVDDFTEAPILQIFADMKAHIVKDNLWGAVSPPFAPQDEHVKWVLNLDNAVRVYRFTVKLRDGSTHVLLKPMFIPAQMKNFMRTQLGVNG